MDERSSLSFLCGVVEGFYGRPWSMEQRKVLFQWMKSWGLNTYMYGPKDDLKHRLLWREVYTPYEAAGLQSLVLAAQQQGVEFIYALSPGQDIVFSSASDHTLLKRKLRQVANLGCKSFALLFDDIDVSMSVADKDIFASFAQAQVSVTNEIYQYLGEPHIFLFCPTEYCNSLCYPSLSKSRYLQTVGEELHPGIEVIWTGPKVVSKELSPDSLEDVAGVLRRHPVIWDNLHANDYDSRRVFLGPYKGRPTCLIPKLRGVLLNPNCEFEANFIPFHTLATWLRCGMGSGKKKRRETEFFAVECFKTGESDSQDMESEWEMSYSAQEALDEALIDWVKEIQQCLEPGRHSHLAILKTDTMDPKSQTALKPWTERGSTFGSVSVQSSKTSQDCMESKDSIFLSNLQLLNSSSKTEVETASLDPLWKEKSQPFVIREDYGMELLSTQQEKSHNQTSGNILPISLDHEKQHRMVTDNGKVSVMGVPPNCPSMQADSRMEYSNISTEGSSNENRLARECPVMLPANGVHTSLNKCPEIREQIIVNEMAPSLAHDQLSQSDLRTLVDLYYLPYEHGEEAGQLLREFQWLRAHSDLVSINGRKSDSQKGEEWRSQAYKFQLQCEKIVHLHGRFMKSANRALLYDLYPYISDIRNMVLIISAFIRWLDGRILSEQDSLGSWRGCFQWCRSNSSPIFLGMDAEPWVYRGGLAGELQMLLPVGNNGELFNHSPPLFPNSHQYTIRPLLPKDKVSLYQMCRENFDIGSDASKILSAHPDLIGDRFLGSFLTLSPEYFFVLEDEQGLCGYAAGAINVWTFLKKCETTWFPIMREKYPKSNALGNLFLKQAVMFFHTERPAFPESVLHHFPSLMQAVSFSRAMDVSAGRSLTICLLSALKANGSQGVFCEVSPTDKQQLDFYNKLGFVEIPAAEGWMQETILLGRLL
ncbi:protein O-GlcNAcase isoform X1 [Microcaecilia unicolor]|uniref:protein O-GlcNAcase n=4 Tax=Microcaecilia unicolor TaxID=1415580 RepID=A0A6P7WU81_9AMPH|nr:protein O-GlcNAcase-like isoform X1 [Microcaecilia unicolor]